MDEIKLKDGDRELVQMMANDMTRAQMAKELSIKTRTLEGRIYRLKLGRGLKQRISYSFDFIRRAGLNNPPPNQGSWW